MLVTFFRDRSLINFWMYFGHHLAPFWLPFWAEIVNTVSAEAKTVSTEVKAASAEVTTVIAEVKTVSAEVQAASADVKAVSAKVQ